MEPALDERGDTGQRKRLRHPIMGPQWSPLSTSGATSSPIHRRARVWEPQWSPLSTSGATMTTPLLPRRPRRAAMEPALDERGDMPAASAVPASLPPQWSPLSTSGATR